jgi:hypothetical protein
MKKVIFLVSFFVCTSLFAQNSILLSTQDGLEVSYSYKLLENGENKDKYLVKVTAKNLAANQMFYAIKAQKNTATGKVEPDLVTSEAIAKVKVRNATGFLASDEVKIKGDKTTYVTKDQTQVLYLFDKDKIYNYENTFNIKHGDTLQVTISTNTSLKPIEGFNVNYINANLEGAYQLTCNNAMATVSIYTDNVSSKLFLISVINGRQTRWLKSASTDVLYIKEGEPRTTLTYNKATGGFTYSNMDGISCDWLKQ